jgi:O-methyltransferase
MFYPVKQKLRKLVESSGYMVVRTQVSAAGHQRAFPYATYAPWLADKDFLECYESVRSHTLVDRYRCWEIWEALKESGKLEEGDCIEIGVWRGGTGCLMAKRVQKLNLTSEVFLCDTFSGVVKAGELDAGYVGGEHADTAESTVRDLARRIGVTVQVLRGVFPEETGAQLENRVFRFCHVDVDVYKSARDTTEWIWPRLLSRGIVVYDDYGFQGCDGVRRFVDEWRVATDCVFLHNLNGHAVLVKP